MIKSLYQIQEDIWYLSKGDKYYFSIHKKVMGINNIMDNLRNEIWKKIGENDYTLKKFAKICGISYGNLRKIIYGRNNDISASTILKICKNSGIKINDIFQEDTPKAINAVVTYNNTKYHGTLSKLN